MIITLVIALALLVLGFLLKQKYGKITTECEKYEFENRSTGGSVSFASFEESKKFAEKKRLARHRHSMGGVLIMFSIFLFICVFLYLKS